MMKATILKDSKCYYFSIPVFILAFTLVYLRFTAGQLNIDKCHAEFIFVKTTNNNHVVSKGSFEINRYKNDESIFFISGTLKTNDKIRHINRTLRLKIEQNNRFISSKTLDNSKGINDEISDEEANHFVTPNAIIRSEVHSEIFTIGENYGAGMYGYPKSICTSNT
ncbi:MAG: hypothetical protein ACRC8R_03965 [Aeromonas hydrophila]